MKALFEFDDYKEFVSARIRTLPKGGHGESRRIAQALRVHTSLVSQVFSGAKDLTPEQAAEFCGYWNLTERESEFFLALVSRSRAGSVKLRTQWDRQISKLRGEAEAIENRVRKDRVLSVEDQGTYYSRWSYGAVRLASPLEGEATPDGLARRLGLDADHVAAVLEFLLQSGLIQRAASGKYELGVQRVHVGPGSPFLAQHHKNWRLKAIERYERRMRLGSDELMFTSPLSIARNDMPKVRQLLLVLIEEVGRIVEATEPDTVACLNLDWLRVGSSR